MKKALMTMGVMLACAGTAAASPLTLDDFEGSFVAAPGGGGSCVDFENSSGSSTDAVYWGDTAGGGCPNNNSQSGYLFNPTNSSFTFDGVGDPNPFSLGEFTLQNEPISAGTAVTAMRYNLTFDTNGSPSALNLVFNFNHAETPNPSGDNFNVTVTPSVTATFIRGTDTFLFTLLGFGTGNGVYTNGFSSPENDEESRNLYGRVVLQQPPSVPEPASLLLLGTGLAFGASRLRRGRDSK